MKRILLILFLPILCQAQGLSKVSKADIIKTVAHLQQLAKDAQAEADKANADLVTVKAQLSTESQAHLNALNQADNLQVKVNSVVAERDNYKSLYESDEKAIKRYHRDIWFFSIITAILFALIANKLVPSISNLVDGAKYWAIGGAAVVGFSLVWSAFGMGYI